MVEHICSEALRKQIFMTNVMVQEKEENLPLHLDTWRILRYVNN